MTSLTTLYAQRDAALAESLRWSQELLRLRGIYVAARDVPALQQALTRAERLQDLASSGAAQLTIKICSHEDHQP